MLNYFYFLEPFLFPLTLLFLLQGFSKATAAKELFPALSLGRNMKHVDRTLYITYVLI